MFSNAEPLLPNSYPVIKASIVSPKEKVMSPLKSSKVSKALNEELELKALKEKKGKTQNHPLRRFGNRQHRRHRPYRPHQTRNRSQTASRRLPQCAYRRRRGSSSFESTTRFLIPL